MPLGPEGHHPCCLHYGAGASSESRESQALLEQTQCPSRQEWAQARSIGGGQPFTSAKNLSQRKGWERESLEGLAGVRGREQGPEICPGREKEGEAFQALTPTPLALLEEAAGPPITHSVSDSLVQQFMDPG